MVLECIKTKNSLTLMGPSHQVDNLNSLLRQLDSSDTLQSSRVWGMVGRRRDVILTNKGAERRQGEQDGQRVGVRMRETWGVGG